MDRAHFRLQHAVGAHGLGGKRPVARGVETEAPVDPQDHRRALRHVPPCLDHHVGIAKGDRQAILHGRKPVRRRVAHEVRRHQPVAAAIDDEHGLVVWRYAQQALKIGETLLAQDGPGDGRRTDIDHPQIEEQALRVVRRLGIVARPDRRLEAVVEFGVGYLQVAGQPSLDQFRPVERLVYRRIGVYRRTACHALHFLSRNGERCGEDRFVCDANGGRGLRHPIEIDEVGAAAGLAIRRADNECFPDRMAAILFEECAQRRFAQAGNEDRLIV